MTTNRELFLCFAHSYKNLPRLFVSTVLMRLRVTLNSTYLVKVRKKLEMWANAQRDGRPAEYRWHLLFNAAKFGWRPLLDAMQ